MPSLKIRMTSVAVTVLAALFVLVARAQDKSAGPISAMIDVRPEHLLAAPTAENWTSYNGD